MPKSLRLTKRREFLALRGPGALKAGAGLFSFVAKPNSLGRNRLGVTATRKTGKAVARNRLKRLAREFFRLNQAQWPQGFDVLLIAKNPEPLAPKEAKAGKKPQVRPKGPAVKKLKGPGLEAGRRLSALMAKAASRGERGL
ncbi:MAG: ribonuclease P protein component [Deltaproteobacteria bacterium]|nr:ribonuclease P protein component [Deltaproteobacteria bacterium]